MGVGFYLGRGKDFKTESKERGIYNTKDVRKSLKKSCYFIIIKLYVYI